MVGKGDEILLERAVVDINTGEILNNPGDRVRIVRKESVDYLQNNADWTDNQFFKGHVNELRLVLPTLSKAKKSLLMSISPYISYYDCHLQWSNGKDLDISAIVRISGYSRKSVIEILRSLVDKDIMYRGKNSASYQWFVNPWLFSRGQTINKVLMTMFKNYYIMSKKCRWKNLF